MSRILTTIITISLSIILVGVLLVPTVENSKQVQYDPDALDVVVLAGQSNIAYVPEYMDVSVVNEDVPLPGADCYFYGYSNRPAFDNAVLSNCDIYNMVENNKWIIGGEEAAIASTISNTFKNDVLTINVGIPGKNITYFEPGNTGGQHIEDVLSDALSKIPENYHVNKCGWVWCQGESDKTTAIDDYVASFEDVRSIFLDYGFEDCYLVQTKPIDSGNSTMAQKKIVLTVPDVFLASTAPAGFTAESGTLIVGNTLHYSQLGRDIVGSQIGQSIIDHTPVIYKESAYNSLIEIIPILMIISILMAAVGALYLKRDD